MEIPTSYDNTMLVTFASCARRFYLFWRGLEPVDTPPYFTFGRVWQECLEVWYVTQGSTEARLGAVLDHAQKAWGDAGSPQGKRDNLDNLVFMLTMYAIEYDKEPWEIIARGDGAQKKMELGFEFPLQGTPYTLSGAIDGYISWKPYGKLVLEDKTAGVPLNDSYMAQWRFSTQCKQYFWGLAQLLGEQPFGVLMNCAWKGISDKAKLAFKQKLEIPEGAFSRDLVKFSEFEIAEFEFQTYLLIEDIVREFNRRVWPKTHNQLECVGGIGKSPCAFRRLCLMDQNPWEMSDIMLLGVDVKFRGSKWEPWKRGGNGE